MPSSLLFAPRLRFAADFMRRPRRRRAAAPPRRRRVRRARICRFRRRRVAEGVSPDLPAPDARVRLTGAQTSLFLVQKRPVRAEKLAVRRNEAPCSLDETVGPLRPSGAGRGAGAPRRRPACAACPNSAFGASAQRRVHHTPRISTDRPVKILGLHCPTTIVIPRRGYIPISVHIRSCASMRKAPDDRFGRTPLRPPDAVARRPGAAPPAHLRPPAGGGELQGHRGGGGPVARKAEADRAGGDGARKGPSPITRQMQFARLEPALRLAARGVAEGDAKAIPLLLKLVDRLDRYCEPGLFDGSPLLGDLVPRPKRRRRAPARRGRARRAFDRSDATVRTHARTAGNPASRRRRRPQDHRCERGESTVRNLMRTPKVGTLCGSRVDGFATPAMTERRA